MTNAANVEIIHRKNRLKEKVSVGGVSAKAGFIDPKLIKNAQNVIEEGDDAYKQEIEHTLSSLQQSWKLLKNTDMQEENYQSTLEDIHRFTNHIKDIASTFSYKLMDYFACSLRDFSEHIDTSLKAHIKIVQAHIDVMTIAYQENIKDDGGPKACELKMIIAQAIDKYSDSDSSDSVKAT